jgi:heme/copper-type cytochrome/quinol oxidase subunit 2
MNILKFNIPHRKLYIYFLFLLVFGVSLSKPLMSISIIGLTINWLFEGGFRTKLKKNKSNFYAPLILSTAFLIEFFWLIKTEVFSDGLLDLKTKLPMLFLPLVIGTSKQLSKQETVGVIFSFFTGLLVSSLLIFAADIHLIATKNSSGTFRDISLFMSHIRYSALLSFGVILLLFLRNKAKHKIYVFILIVWFLYMLYIMQSLTGILCLVLGCLLYLMFALRSKEVKKRIKIAVALGIPILGIILYSAFICIDYNTIKDKNKLTQLPQKTHSGEKYIHDTNNLELENGNYLWINIAPNEVEKTWNKISNIKFSSEDQLSQPIKYTLYRYLTSKGLKKDREGVISLTTSDIKNIEKGRTTHVKYNAFEKRIRGVLFEIDNYLKGKKTNNHSLAQRITFLTIAKQIFKENILFGKGPGGTKEAYRKFYQENQEGLSHKNQLRAHNQIITQIINLGLLGFLIWVISLAYPIFIINEKYNALYYSFLLIIFINFLSDDMLERQAGVTIFTTINTLFLFGIKKATPPFD